MSTFRHTYMRKGRAFFLNAIVLALSTAAWTQGMPAVFAETALPTPHQAINTLTKRVYVTSEVDGKRKSYDQAEYNAVEAIRTFVAQGGDSTELTAAPALGLTPLHVASYRGYARVVEALLEIPQVRSTIDQTDERGNTAWHYANFAIGQSKIVCNPTIIMNTFTLVRFMVKQTYYRDYGAYQRTRAILEAAGAKTDMDELRERWNTHCPHQGKHFRIQTGKAPDLQAYLIEAGWKQLNRLSESQRNK